MSNTPHDLTEEFPDQRERISELKTTNAHFARLAEEYSDLNRQIHRIETRVEPTSEDVEDDLKQRRVHLKDEIQLMLQGEAHTPSPTPTVPPPRPAGNT